MEWPKSFCNEDEVKPVGLGSSRRVTVLLVRLGGSTLLGFFGALGMAIPAAMNVFK